MEKFRQGKVCVEEREGGKYSLVEKKNIKTRLVNKNVVWVNIEQKRD